MDCKKMMLSDPIEQIIADALFAAGIAYRHDSEGNQRLDFVLESGLAIECKQFPTPRTGAQIEDEPNVIVIQGRQAAEFFAWHVQ